MPKYKVEYTHVEETTYYQWVEAETEKEAVENVRGDETFENVKDVQGLELKDYNASDKE